MASIFAVMLEEKDDIQDVQDAGQEVVTPYTEVTEIEQQILLEQQIARMIQAEDGGFIDPNDIESQKFIQAILKEVEK